MNRQRPHPVPYLYILLTLFVFTACSGTGAKQVTRGYYFWRNETWLRGEERTFLGAHDIHRLYCKVMDIDWSESYGAYPLHINYPEEMNHYANPKDSVPIEIVPVVFLTNRVFSKTDSASIPQLAKHILRKCMSAYDETDSKSEAQNTRYYYPDRPKSFQPREIQFDCDWTATTADMYFYLLRTIKELLPDPSITLSATIRLHQFKYPGKTGVPPVNRGMLMVYNISDLTKFSTGNSIFNYREASRYFTRRKKYDLPLDIALPAYSWGIIFRNKKFYQIENQLTQDTLQHCRFLKHTGNNIYAVQQDTVFNWLELRPGDEIKMETIDDATLLKAAQLARKALNTDTVNVVLFELSTEEIKNYAHETIEQVYHTFR